MNLYHTKDLESWKRAPKECRSDFLERMRDCEYSAGATKDAWEWYVMGWTDAKPDVEWVGGKAATNE